MPCILDTKPKEEIESNQNANCCHSESSNLSNGEKHNDETNVNGESVKSDDEETNTSKESTDTNEITEPNEPTKAEDSADSKDTKDPLEDIPLKLFNVKLLITGVSEPVRLQISNHDTVQEIRQVVLDRPESCFRTCFSLQLDGNRLDDFVELHAIEEMKEEAVVRVVDESYSVREARIHIRRLRDLLSTTLLQNALTATDNLSLSFCSAVAGLDPEEEVLKERKEDQSIPSEECAAPVYSLLEDEAIPLLEPLVPENTELKIPPCLKNLRYSSWNPPPGPRKLAGDLLYIDISTLEDNQYYVTASSSGFYVNRTTRAEFDPRPSNEPCRSQTLVGLLLQLSPLFKKNFAIVQRQSIKRHPLEVVPSPYQVYPWVSPNFEHTPDPFRAEDAVTSRIGYEEQIPGQLRDWNEELQSARELPKKTSHQRILRERAIYKISSDFVAAANKGAVAVVDGNVMAINPGEDEKMRMYIWNNIFFSLACDSRFHYKCIGGDEAAYAAAGADLKGVAAYNRLDIDGLYTLGTVIVDYRGYRVIAQSIIPGILQREQENSVVYGSIDAGKTISGSEKFLELLKKAGASLRIRSHKVINEKDEEVELCSSLECKGIIGADGRHYILDLFRTLPPDANFVDVTGKELKPEKDVKSGDSSPEPEDTCEIAVESEITKTNEPVLDENKNKNKSVFQLPTSYRHQLCTLRQTLLEDFVRFRYVLFLRLCGLYSQQMKASREKESTENDENKKGESTPIVAQTTPEPEGVNGLDLTLNIMEEPVESDIKEEAIASDTNKEPTASDTNKEPTASDTNKEPTASDTNKEPTASDTNEETIASDIRDEPNTTDIKKESKKWFDLSEKVRDDVAKQAVRQAAKTMCSQSESDFDMRFNPDIYVHDIKSPESEKTNLDVDRLLTKDASNFLSETMIPKMVEDFIILTHVPLDGIALTEAMHTRGINMRYLGEVAALCSTREDLEHIYRISVAEMILRAAKRHFKACMQSATLRTLSAAVSHFLNCFLSSCSTPQPHLPPEENLKKKKSKKKGKSSGSSSSSQIAWVSLSPLGLWKRIQTEVKNHFGYEINCENIEELVEKYNIQRISLFRGLCKKTGVQVLLREYDFDNRKHPTFTEDDILNIFPVVKHLDPPATDANNLFEVAQGRLQAGFFGEAHDLMIEALNTYNQVYGPLHGDIVTCFRAVARLHYLAEDVAQAVAYQKKACIVAERVFGIDHPETITAYVHLALYCYSAGLTAISLKLMYRARYLALLVYGEGHPDLATFDTNIGLMLHSQREFKLSLKFLERALNVQQKFHGPNSIQTATSYHLVARAKCCLGDFRSALLSEKAAFLIHKKMFGEDDVRTKESSEYLKQMTHQAVRMQKTLNEISGKVSGRAIGPPPKTSVSKVSEEHYDRKILGEINRLEESQSPVKSPKKNERKC